MIVTRFVKYAHNFNEINHRWPLSWLLKAKSIRRLKVNSVSLALIMICSSHVVGFFSLVKNDLYQSTYIRNWVHANTCKKKNFEIYFLPILLGAVFHVILSKMHDFFCVSRLHLKLHSKSLTPNLRLLWLLYFPRFNFFLCLRILYPSSTIQKLQTFDKNRSADL